MKVDNACLTADIYIQLNGPNKVRLVNYMAQYVDFQFRWLFCVNKNSWVNANLFYENFAITQLFKRFPFLI